MKEKGLFKRSKDFLIETFGNKETLYVELHNEVINDLKALAGINNLTMVEVPFLGLGSLGIIDGIICPSKESLSGIQRNHWNGVIFKQELNKMFKILEFSGEKEYFNLLGFVIPTGSIKYNQGLVNVVITRPGSKYSLTPEMHLVNYIKNFKTLNPTMHVKYSAFAVRIGEKTAIRIYDTEELVKTLKPKEVDKVPQKTIYL